MIFDVMLLLKEKNVAGKERRIVSRVHDRDLNKFLRDAQDRGDYIEQANPLFKPKLKEVISKHILLQDESAFNKEYVLDPIDDRAMIDPHGF